MTMTRGIWLLGPLLVFIVSCAEEPMGRPDGGSAAGSGSSRAQKPPKLRVRGAREVADLYFKRMLRQDMA
ncbi:MAG: hypothetical protein KAI47_19885, partial [Deltaproteobacteria bacterium]|nr:hypothetical protein [Deltaproteobacteria bacterium]